MASLDYFKFFPEIGQEVWHFPHLLRAMDILKSSIKIFPKTANGRIIRANSLLNAKGRFNRMWIAEKGGLWMALSIYDEFLKENHSLIPLIPALAMIKTVHYFGAKEVKIKWINDLHYKGKKLAGVLMERFEDWFIIGIGMNVNNYPPSNLPAISLKQLLKKEVSILELLEYIIFWLRYYFGFLRHYERCNLEEIFIKNAIIEDYKKFSDTAGRCVAFSYNLEDNDVIIGKAIDITDKGSLLIKSWNSSKILEAFSGEIIYVY